jgi:response regulator RpfG family c-di-GMP phosphodiesterase
MDVPLMDGCQVAQQLRLDFARKDCFIIAAADWADETRCQQCSESGIDLLLVKPLNPALIEMLLLLECELVNRSWTDHEFSSKASSQFTEEDQSPANRDNDGETGRSPLWQALRAGKQGRSRYETGGFSC